MSVEWDPRKALINLRGHGVSFEEAKTVFGDWNRVTAENVMHSEGEDRYRTIGMSDRGRILVVTYTIRHDRFRLITARRAALRERNAYERS